MVTTLVHCDDVPEILPNDNDFCGSYTAPTINDLFPNTASGVYWTASVFDATDAWFVSFNTSTVSNVVKNINRRFRCVSN